MPISDELAALRALGTVRTNSSALLSKENSTNYVFTTPQQQELQRKLKAKREKAARQEAEKLMRQHNAGGVHDLWYKRLRELKARKKAGAKVSWKKKEKDASSGDGNDGDKDEEDVGLEVEMLPDHLVTALKAKYETENAEEALDKALKEEEMGKGSILSEVMADIDDAEEILQADSAELEDEKPEKNENESEDGDEKKIDEPDKSPIETSHTKDTDEPPKDAAGTDATGEDETEQKEVLESVDEEPPEHKELDMDESEQTKTPTDKQEPTESEKPDNKEPTEKEPEKQVLESDDGEPLEQKEPDIDESEQTKTPTDMQGQEPVESEKRVEDEPVEKQPTVDAMLPDEQIITDDPEPKLTEEDSEKIDDSLAATDINKTNERNLDNVEAISANETTKEVDLNQSLEPATNSPTGNETNDENRKVKLFYNLDSKQFFTGDDSVELSKAVIDLSDPSVHNGHTKAQLVALQGLIDNLLSNW